MRSYTQSGWRYKMKNQVQPLSTRIADTRKLQEIMHYHGVDQFKVLLKEAYLNAADELEDLDLDKESVQEYRNEAEACDTTKILEEASEKCTQLSIAVDKATNIIETERTKVEQLEKGLKRVASQPLREEYGAGEADDIIIRDARESLKQASLKDNK